MKPAIPREPTRAAAGAGGPTREFSPIDALQKIGQPWNPAVRCAIALLRSNTDHRCWRARFPYAARVYANAMWEIEIAERFDGDNWRPERLPASVKGGAIGIILSGRVEVVVEEPAPEKTGEGVKASAIRPCPWIVMSPGAIIGSFEHTDYFLNIPSNYGYSLRAGPVCLQIAHPDYFAFAPNKAGIKALQKLLGRLDDKKTDQRAFMSLNDWESTGENYRLVTAFAERTEIEKAHAEILILPVDAFSKREKEMLAMHQSVLEAAWRQSTFARRWTFPVQRDPTTKLNLTISADYARGFHETIDHISAALREEDLVWAPFDPSIHDFPALKSFVSRIAELPAVKDRVTTTLASGDLYITNLLGEVAKYGTVSLTDHLFTAEWDHKDEKWIDEFDSVQTRNDRAISHMIDLFASYIPTVPEWQNRVKLRAWDPHRGLSNKCYQRADVSKNHPFERLAIEIDSAAPRLSVLEELKHRRLFHGRDLGDVLIVACQHLLRETECWFDHLIQTNTGVRILLMGKDYSTAPASLRRLNRYPRQTLEIVDNFEWSWRSGEYGVHLKIKARRLWDTAERVLAEQPRRHRVLVIDDGGVLIGAIPQGIRRRFNVSIVEQTQSGVPSALASGCPGTNVAQCDAKKKIESYLIARTILRKSLVLCRELYDLNTPIGIIGTGALGTMLYKHLQEKKYTSVLSADLKTPASPADLFSKSDVVFGCAGVDVSPKDLTMVRAKWLISCSSTDVEFRTLLGTEPQPVLPYHPFSTMFVTTPGGNIVRIANGGFPVNFDREPESVPLEEIQLTRGLMHAAVFQALDIDAHAKKSVVPLSSEYQRDVVSAWIGNAKVCDTVKAFAKNVLPTL